MAIRFIDSFSHYDDAHMFSKWTTPQAEAARFPGGTIVAGSGRCLQNALQVNRSSGTTIGTGPCRLIDKTLTEGCVGVGVKYPAVGIDSPSGFSIFVIKNLGVLTGNTQLEIGINSDGTLRAFTLDAFNGIVELDRTTFSIAADSWHFVECVFKIHNTLGVCQIWVDGIKRLDLSNVNTTCAVSVSNNWTVAQLGMIYQGSGASSGFLQFSDFYCGDAQTDRKGDSRVYARLPNVDGTYSQWTPNPIAPHYQNVDDNPPNDDTDYNYSSTPGQLDTYGFPQISIPGGIVYAVQVLPLMKKDSVGSRVAAPVIVQGGVAYVGTDQPLADGNYLYYYQLYEKDPTGATWTSTNASNDEFGVKLTG